MNPTRILPPADSVSDETQTLYDGSDIQMAFSINFVRKQSRSIHMRRVGVIVLSVYALGQILLMGWLFVSAQSSWVETQEIQGRSSWTEEADALAQTREQVEQLHTRAIEDLGQVQRVLGSQKERFFAGGKIATLTRTLPARTWITQLSGDRQSHQIKAQAAYWINPEAPYELPVKEWIKQLHEDTSFSQNLSRLEIGTSSRQKLGKAELYTFTLIAQWN